MMNTIDAYKKLEEIEIYIKNKLDKKNQYYWPIIKGWLWRYYLYGNKKQKKIEIISELLKKYFRIFYSSLFNIIFFSFTNSNENIKILFITRKVYERKLKNGLFTDKFIDPLIKLLEVLKNPYFEQKNIIDYQKPSSSKEKYQTFCGT